jgi:TPP-dependent pyruvate/acetoin dehydrogenase alpha subunit
VRLLLERAGGWTREWQDELETQAAERVEEAVTEAEALPDPTFEEMLLRMYGTPTGPLRAQLGEADR